MRGRSGNYRTIHSPASRTCDWRHEITRIRMEGTRGTTARSKAFSFGTDAALIRHRLSFGGGSYVGYVESNRTLPRPRRGVSPPCSNVLLNRKSKPLPADGRALKRSG